MIRAMLLFIIASLFMGCAPPSSDIIVKQGEPRQSTINIELVGKAESKKIIIQEGEKVYEMFYFDYDGSRCFHKDFGWTNSPLSCHKL